MKLRHAANILRPAAVALLVTFLLATPASANPTPPYINRLANSADPYLLEHAHNPVDWYPWGREAFAKAKAEDKPIFLSIGYSTCFWCHVAEKTIYSDPAIAKLMNEWFVNVKVDREELPAVDRLYMDATSMLNGRGAWPNNLFLTPAGAPFFAGSYFPPKDDAGTQGFPTVLAAIHDLWINHRAEKVTPAANEMMEALHRLADRQKAAAEVPVAPRVWLAGAVRTLLAGIDPVNGGLGRGGAKYPQAPALSLLATASRLEHDKAAGDALRKTLDGMADGGIHDQLGGGFFRYATDPAWSLPHFEKMLSDNAQLLALYVESGEPREREVAQGVARFLLRDMQLPGGGFATALDAQSGGVEGGTYLWTRRQIEEVLGSVDATRFLSIYALTPLPDGGGAGVLRVRLPAADFASLAALAPLRAKLFAARAARAQPARDDKLVVGWNGLAIGALARAGKARDMPEAVAAASKAADLIWAEAFQSGVLAHQIYAGTAAGEATPEDYAALGDGFLDLADVTGETSWRERARQLADIMLKRFSRADGSFGAEAGLLPLALGDDADADLPSGTSSALDLLGGLAAMPGSARFEQAQARIAARLSGSLAAQPAAWPSAVAALAENPPKSDARPRPVAGPAEPHVPATADHVRASYTAAPDAGGQAVAVTLHVDPGWHVNAHVPSLDYLVPTDLAFAGASPEGIGYPAGRSFKPGFSAVPLSVYEGDVTVTARLAAGATGWRATLTAQACDAHTCLPPSTVPVQDQR